MRWRNALVLMLSAVLVCVVPVHADLPYEVAQLKGHPAKVACLAFSADGKRLLSTCRTTNPASHQEETDIRIWQVPTGRLQGSFRCPDMIDCLALSRDGKQLATAGYVGTVKVWRIALPGEGPALVEGKTLAKDSSMSWSKVAFSPDGQRLAAAAHDTVRMWNIATGEQLSSFKLPVRSNWPEFSPDLGTLAATNSEDLDLWEAATGKLRRSFFDHRGEVVRSRFSANGHLLAVLSSRDVPRAKCFVEVKLWNLTTGHALSTLNEPQGFARDMVLDPAGRFLILQMERALSGPANLRFIALPSGRLLGAWGCKTTGQSPTCLELNPSGRFLAAGFRDGTVRLWRLGDETTNDAAKRGAR